MSIQNRFNADMDRIFKPHTSEELYEIDYARGIKDAENGVRFVDQGLAYTEGYFFQCASQTAKEASK